MKKIGVIVFTVLVALIFSNCKKSENDPLFSTKSRHTRACGLWTISSGSITSTYVDRNGVSSSVTYSLNNKNFTAEITGRGTLVGKFSLQLDMRDDDSFEVKQEFGGPLETYAGKWQFLHKSKDYKNKERMLFTLNANAASSVSLLSFSKGGFSFNYTINELSNDNKLVLVCEKELVLAEAVNGKSERYYISAQYVLQK